MFSRYQQQREQQLVIDGVNFNNLNKGFPGHRSNNSSGKYSGLYNTMCIIFTPRTTTLKFKVEVRYKILVPPVVLDKIGNPPFVEFYMSDDSKFLAIKGVTAQSPSARKVTGTKRSTTREISLDRIGELLGFDKKPGAEPMVMGCKYSQGYIVCDLSDVVPMSEVV